ncbi:BamA/OMP85 family outer membrane protein [Salinibacter altiplanensis]|uniref:BamA/OMP85 family outer membrane protein n=1 Tax=Salinibacter altiplanensis TaxID=1803181 RepID=UPI001E5D9058|nr:BamA/TamA family outer membrane protein [Salinibacter altiplanensis]
MLLLLVLSATLATSPRRAPAQAPLRSADANTSVHEISFRFVDQQTFAPSRLREQIGTTGPGTLTRLRNRVSFLPGLQARRLSFNPVVLQKDVVRLRQFYQRNGFPSAEIDYPATQLDSSRNRIHIIFTIREGPSVQIHSADFVEASSGAPFATTLPDALQGDWAAFRRGKLSVGGRYTDFERTQIKDRVQAWLRNRGFAFARVQSSASVDTTQYAADLRFMVDSGPRTVFSEIQVDGNASVDRSIILRELPFAVGDRFSADAVTEGQQKLFDLNLFRVALADVPSQPRDSTTTVRYRVRERDLRGYSGEVGYDTRSGITVNGSWRHRNFYGNGRAFLVNLIAETGYPNFLAQPSSQELSRRLRASVTLRQPYILSRDLSGSLSPFVEERLNPALAPDPTRPLDLNERRFGLESTLVYDFIPYRTVSFRHSLSRTQQFSALETADAERPGRLTVEDDLFSKSIFTLNGTFGAADDFLNPTEGYILRPTAKVGGLFLKSGVEFVQLSAEVSGYLPVSSYLEVASRVFVGSTWPFGESLDNLSRPSNPSATDRRENLIFQNRFSDNLFYAGGGSDVRGWSSRLAGGKVLRESSVLSDGFAYRPIGARSKVGLNLEARFPLPGLGSNWRTAAFLDGAYVTSGALDLTPPATAPSIISGPDGTPVSTDPSQVLVGTGAGLRYETSFGFLRVDLAYKLTPDALDLRAAEDVGAAVTADNPSPLSDVDTGSLQRFRLHFGIGRSF